MVRQTIAILTMTAIANLTVGGCSKVVNMRLDEVAVDTPKRITAVVSKAGEEVTFDEKGGKYDATNKRIAGTNSDGLRLNKGLRDIDAVRVVSDADSSQNPISIAADTFHEYFKPKQLGEVASIVTRQSVVHKFQFGRIDPRGKVVCGFSTADSLLTVPFDSVAFIGVRKTDWVKTGILVSLGSAAAEILLVLIVASAVVSGIRGAE